MLHQAMLKDLVPSLAHIVAHYSAARPWLRAQQGSAPHVLQSATHRVLLEMHYECILCASCSASCPSYWWLTTDYVGPAVVLQMAR